MDADSSAAKEHKARKELLPLRLDRGEGRGEVSNLCVLCVLSRQFHTATVSTVSYNAVMFRDATRN